MNSTTGPTPEEKEHAAREVMKHREEVSKLLSAVVSEIGKRMELHDRSKLKDPELGVFAKMTPKLKGSTYGSPEYMEMLDQMKPALDHHYTENRHHPEHFDHGIADMNLIDLIEYICDCMAATKRHSDGDIQKSIVKNTERHKIPEAVVMILKNTVTWLQEQKK